MASKFVVFGVLLISLAVAQSYHINQEVNKPVDTHSSPVQQRQPKLLNAALIGTVIYKLGKVLFFVLTSTYAIVGYKLAAIALLVHSALWVLKHATSMVIGAALMFGFCKMSGKCGPIYDHAEEPYYSSYSYQPYLEQAEHTWRKAARFFESDN